MPAPRTVIAYEQIEGDQLEGEVEEVAQDAADAAAAAAAASASAAAAVARANHTGTQPISTVLAAASPRLFGRITASGGAGEELTAAQGRTVLRSGCLAKRNSDAVAQDYSAGATLFWAGEEYDDETWHSTSANTDRLVVPSGIVRVRVGFTLEFANVTAGATIYMIVNKNGAAFVGSPGLTDAVGVTNPRYAASSGPIAVSAADYFNVVVICSDTSVDLIAASSGFWIEAV